MRLGTFSPLSFILFRSAFSSFLRFLLRSAVSSGVSSHLLLLGAQHAAHEVVAAHEEVDLLAVLYHSLLRLGRPLAVVPLGLRLLLRLVHVGQPLVQPVQLGLIRFLTLRNARQQMRARRQRRLVRRQHSPCTIDKRNRLLVTVVRTLRTMLVAPITTIAYPVIHHTERQVSRQKAVILTMEARGRVSGRVDECVEDGTGGCLWLVGHVTAVAVVVVDVREWEGEVGVAGEGVDAVAKAEASDEEDEEVGESAATDRSGHGHDG